MRAIFRPVTNTGGTSVAIRMGRTVYWVLAGIGFLSICVGTFPFIADINRYRLQEDRYEQKVVDDREIEKHDPYDAALRAGRKPTADEFLAHYVPDVPPLAASEEGFKPDPVDWKTVVLAWVVGTGLFALGRSVRYILANE